MTADNSIMSFGNYLRTARIEQGIGLEEIANEIKIGPDILLNIENENLSALPAEVFVKGFLRSYAKALGVNGDRVVRSYQSSLAAFQKFEKVESELLKSGEKIWLRLLVSLMVLGCFMAITFYALSGPPDAASDMGKHVRETGGKGSGDSPVNRQASSAGKERPAPAAERLLLRIKTIEDTYLEVTIDGGDTDKYILRPGDRLELKASTGFSVLLGNAGGVEMTVNDKPVVIPGESGNVVSIDIP